MRLSGTYFPRLVRFTAQNKINNVEAWVTYPNTVTGPYNGDAIVWSMNPLDPNRQQPPSNRENQGGTTEITREYHFATDSSVTVDLIPSWIPDEDDLVSPNLQAHCCILANSSGVFDSESTQRPVGMSRIGDDDLTNFTICTEPHQGQRNVVILPAAHNRNVGGAVAPVNFGFLSGHADPNRDVGHFTVDIKPVASTGEDIDPSVDSVLLSSGAYKGLPLKKSTTPFQNIRLGKNGHRSGEWLEKVVVDPEDVAEAVVADDVGKLFGLEDGGFDKGVRLGTRLYLSTKGMTKLLLETKLDKGEEVGAVHVFDIVQTDLDSANAAESGLP